MLRINAFFSSISDANKTAKALREKGLNGVHLDMAGAFDYEYSSELSATAGDNTPGLSSLATRSSDQLHNPGKTTSISPGTSIAGIGCEDCSDIAANLHIKLEEKDAEEARRIIGENGGRFF